MRETTDNIVAGAQTAWATTLSFLPKLGLFLVVLIAGYFLAKWLGKFVDRLLERIGFDNWVERGGIKRALARTRYDASDILSKLVFYALFLFVLQLAFGVFGPNPISAILTQVIAFIPSLIVAMLIVVVASAIAKGVKELTQVALGNLSYGRMLASLASTAVVVIGIFAALSHLQIAPAIVNGLFYAGLAIIAGSAIIAIGGGGIAPMRTQWERALGRIQAEAPRLKDQAAQARERAREHVETRKEEMKTSMAEPHEEHPAVEETPRFPTQHL